MAEQDANNVAITGGAINNTTVGATTPAAGTFTTLTASGSSYLGGSSTSRSVQVDSVAGGTSQYTLLSRDAASNTQKITAAGTANLSLQATGGGVITFNTADLLETQLRIARTASAVNYIQATGSATGVGVTLSAQGSDSNIQFYYASKGTNPHSFLNGAGNEQFRVASTASAVNYVLVTGGATGSAVQIQAQGSDSNVFLQFYSKGTSGFNFLSASGANRQLRIDGSTSSVNYFDIWGGASGTAPSLRVAGTDTDIGLQLRSKGTGAINLMTAGGTNQVVVLNTASAVNYATITGSATGFGVVHGVDGSDTNIPLVLQPKGTGALQAQQTDSTATGGNARGANAVDWQTSRASASQVASGTGSVISGGINNTSTGNYNFVGGGQTNAANFSFGGIASGASNTVTANYAFIGGGNNNQILNSAASNNYSFIGGGATNVAHGVYNVTVGGFTNAGTTATAVTTQSATMNGTTAVTLSGSNASIKVGQYITGTSISGNTYVAAISGTSLTLSQAASGSSTNTLSFYTPHGVVVGGGNNQATGSYSFIGGGGDAGTAGNRNVASGDWSAVVGGQKNVASAIYASAVGGTNNTASGQGSFIGGGGWFGSGSNSNSSSGTSSFVGAGYGNTSSGFTSSILGGAANIANSNFSVIVGGALGNTRAIVASFVHPSGNPLNSVQGASQSALLVLARETTNATPTVLTSDTAAASTTNQIILPNNSAYFFTGEVVAGVTGGGNTKGWTIEGVIKRGANAASTALVGSPMVVSGYADVGAATWTIALSADTTNGGLAVTFTGQAATTIRCVAQIRTTEMNY
jgi:hypothetical protein